ncbi:MULTISPECIES: S41 family peptidase [unclassified Duganella]|uniref:S41 family peptidase n=1 Tax=unclassified Duganella TaxID=2636909 RepID=UPI000E350120|nr:MULTISPECIES: S41 family peptidase [unclassified Duganella]RFP19070.1 hypothetical protein D0T23_04610 [Duganella sp. BJB475]RFP35732.1 hypothetical protein D0T21_04610 [Duganella sp. BJB476]
MILKPLAMLVLAALFTPLALAADATTPPLDAGTPAIYQYMRAQRSEAQRLSEPASATPDDLKRAVPKYQKLLDYLATPQVSEHANGYKPLYAENINLLLPLAGVYARLGMKEQALAALERVQGMLWMPAFSAMLAGPEFNSLRDEPRFKAVQQTMALPDRLYKVPAIATPYKAVLTVEEKVAGLSLFWAEARESFVHFDHVPGLAWDQVYMDYLTKVIAAPTTRDYYRIMMQLAPLLQDGHTNIYPPEELSDELYARPPLRTVLVEDKVLVERVGNPALQARLHVGDEIVAVDDEPVLEYGHRRIEPFVSASTPQDRAMRTYSYQLLMGDAGKPLTLRVRGADGTERDEVVERSGSYQAPQQFVFKTLPGDIAYISIDHFENDESVRAFEKAVPDILKAKGLVIDVRRNGGGSSGFGLRILSWLSRQPIGSAASYRRDGNAVMRAQVSPAIFWTPTDFAGDTYKAQHKEVFNGPVAVLTSAQTFSAAEDFAVAFRLMKRGIIVGEATGGSTGQPLFIQLPGGGSARICVKRDVYPDGSAFVGKGVMPDVEVRRTVTSLRAGADPVLDRAVAELRK